MRQEYLFQKENVYTELKKYDPNSGFPQSLSTTDLEIHFSRFDITNTTQWIAVFETKSSDKNAARKLSAVDSYVIGRYHPIVLTNEASEYFNKALYPRVNYFERLFRKLLYLMASLNPDGAKNIKDLEEKDFGTIFNLLFTDEEFVKKVKNKVKSANAFSKNQITNVIDAVDENTAWDMLGGSTLVPSLDKNFLKLKEYRNDVMHAHNINYDRYIKAKKLYDNSNSALRNAIENLSGTGGSEVPVDFNENMAIVLKAFANTVSSIASEENVENIKKGLAVIGAAANIIVDDIE